MELQRQSKLFKNKSSLKDSPVSLSELAKQLLDFSRELKDMLFYSPKAAGTAKQIPGSAEKTNFLKFQKGVSINKSWLKVWHKNMKKSKNRQGNKYPLNSVGTEDKKSKKNSENFEEYLNRWIKNWYEKSRVLEKFSNLSQNEKIKHSEIAEIIRFFLNRNQYDYIDQFLTELNTKEALQDQKIKNLKDSLKGIRKNLKRAEQKYSSSQSSGIEITKAGFNYFTLNKEPKEYYDNQIKKIKKELYGFVRDEESNKSSSEDSNKIREKDNQTAYKERDLKLQNSSQKKHKIKKENIFSIIKKTSDKNNKSYQWSCNPDWSGDKSDSQKDQNKKNQKEIFCFKNEQENLWIERVCKICFKNKAENTEKWNIRYCFQCKKEEEKNPAHCLDKDSVFLSLEQTYTAMKVFKAEQKTVFYDVITYIASNQGKNYNAQNKNHILKDWILPYDQLNMEGVNKVFSLFEFKDKKKNWFSKVKEKKEYQTIYAIISRYKNEQGEALKKDFYKVFCDLTKDILQSANKNNPTAYMQKNRSRHPKDIPDGEKDTRKATKKVRGAFLFGKYAYFEDYGNFCEKYKKIAQKRGQRIAQIKGIKRERQESRQTDFWSLIYCDGDKKQLWLVPKEITSKKIENEESKKSYPSEISVSSELKRKMETSHSDNHSFNESNQRQKNRETLYIQKARDFIYSQERQRYTKGDSQYLCSFESLTMRALHKLCFAEQSSFVASMPSDLKRMQKDAKEIKTDGDKQKLKEKNQKKLKFLKEVLKSDYANERLKLDNFDLQKVYEAKSLEEFEKTLETACYFVQKVPFHTSEKERFLKNFDVTVLDITSYDLEGQNKNTHQTPASENRRHTDLWLKFWKNEIGESNLDGKIRDVSVGKVRLNPELKIHYRKASKSLKDYFEQSRFPLKKKTRLEKFAHRGLREQFTVHFTLALNAGKKYDDLAFAKPEEIFEKIKKFNKKLNQEMDFNTAWKYGIDRGQKELATLCLVKFDPSKNACEEKNIKPEFPNSPDDIKCWTLKDYSYAEEYTTKEEKVKKRYAIKNISYFVDNKYLNNKELFKQEDITCLDVTTAKVIKGKIITNGDVLTYLKLKKTVAKRRIYELYHKGRITQEVKLEWSEWEDGKKNNEEENRPEGILNIKTSDGEKTIYRYIKKYENIPLKLDEQSNIQTVYNKNSIEIALNSYLNQLRQKNNNHNPSILQINHLRDAVIANMVGVICRLQEKYQGFVILEDLSKGLIDRHFFQSNENIARRLENALYNKFQILGLVPPHTKDIIQLRETYRQKNKSSQIGAIVFVPEKDTSQKCPYCEMKNCRAKKKNEKFKQGRFICDFCRFDTYLFKEKKDRVRDYEPEVQNGLKDKFKQFEVIDNPDKVAAYNVAKVILKSEDIGKWSDDTGS